MDRECRDRWLCLQIQEALLADGSPVSRTRLAHLMRELGLEGVTRRHFKPDMTKKNAKAWPTRGLVN